MRNKINPLELKKSLKFFNIFVCIMLIQSLTACSTDDTAETSKTSINTNDDNKSLETSQEESKFSSLIITHKCIGCGRCSMTDPEHFAQYSRNSKAIVKSQNNLDSKKIAQAIRICPTKSIKLL